MKLYITEETKKELEDKIAELIEKENDEFFDEHLINDYIVQIRIYKKILSEAIVLPVEESWDDVLSSTERTDCLYSCRVNSPNGVIIKSK